MLAGMQATHCAQTASASPRGDDVVARLRQSELFGDYQDAFQTATGLPLVLREAGSFQAPLHGARQPNRLCAMLTGSSRTCATCLQVQQEVERDPGADGKTVRCFAGLAESVVPVRVGERIIAYLQTGQVMTRPPTEHGFRAALAELSRWRATVDVELLRSAYFETRVLPRARYQAALRLLASFAQHLSLLSNELMIRSTAARCSSSSRRAGPRWIACHKKLVFILRTRPAIRLSSVDMPLNSAMFWNVRAIPCAAASYGCMARRARPL